MSNQPNPTVITVYGAQSRITGPYPKDKFSAITSYEVEGAKFSPLYRKGAWDGKKKLGNVRTGSFPTGLLPDVVTMLQESGIEVVIQDTRTEPGRMDLWGQQSFELTKYKLRPYQLEAAKAAVAAKRGIIKAATGSGKSIILASVITALNVPTLVIVPSRELLHQLRATFLEAIPNASERTIGMIGDNEWQVGTHVTVATLSTLHARFETDECQGLLKSIDLLCVDEVHLAGADTYYDVVQSCNAYWRIACSGTPYDRTDGGTMRLIASFGPKVADIGYKELVDAGVLPRAKIIFDKITGPILPKKPKLTYPQAYSQGVVHNEELTKRIVEWTKICVDQGLSVLILVDQIEHGKLIDAALWNGINGEMISHTFIHGSSSNRDEALGEFSRREIPVLIGSSILDTGISIDSIDVLLCAGSRKSKIKTIQRLGRALRGEKAIVIEFYSFVHKFLLEHSKQRFQDYRAEGCFILKQSRPNAELIKRLWEMP